MQRRQAGDHREIVRLERRAVAQRVLQRVEDGVEHLGPEERRSHRHVAAGERLRQREDVRLEPPVLEREELAGAPEARLHLVDAEERAVAAAQLLRALQIARGRQEDAVADDGLDDEERHVLGAQRGLERVEVAERDAREAGQERLEAFGEGGIARRRERAERQPVEAALDGDDARAARRRAPDLDRRLDRLRPGAREEHAAEARGRPPQQLVGEDRAQRVDAERELSRRVELQRLRERRLHPRVVAADVVHPEPAEPVEVAVPLGVVEVRTLGACPAAVEADRAQHPHELRVDDARVELQLVARMPLEQLADAEVAHGRRAYRAATVATA